MAEIKGEQLTLQFEPSGATVTDLAVPAGQSGETIQPEEKQPGEVVTLSKLRAKRKTSEEAEILNNALLQLEKLQA